MPAAACSPDVGLAQGATQQSAEPEVATRLVAEAASMLEMVVAPLEAVPRRLADIVARTTSLAIYNALGVG